MRKSASWRSHPQCPVPRKLRRRTTAHPPLRSSENLTAVLKTHSCVLSSPLSRGSRRCTKRGWRTGPGMGSCTLSPAVAGCSSPKTNGSDLSTTGEAVQALLKRWCTCSRTCDPSRTCYHTVHTGVTCLHLCSSLSYFLDIPTRK